MTTLLQYNTPVGPNTKFYDAGVELTPDGFFGRHDYIKHATRGTLNIHSLYFVLWTNFCGFSVALLTQKDAEQKLVGKIVSEEEPVRLYCLKQVFMMWNLLKEKLNILEEERLFLVRGCLNNVLEVQFSSLCILGHVLLLYFQFSMILRRVHLPVEDFVQSLSWTVMKQFGIMKFSFQDGPH